MADDKTTELPDSVELNDEERQELMTALTRLVERTADDLELRAAQARAELDKLKAQQRLLQAAIRLEVTKVHGELLAVDAFPAANGVVARAASRLVGAATGLDPHCLGVPEVTWFKKVDEYRSLATGFGTGEPAALGAWIVFCCEALEAGAGEARSIAEAARAG